MPLNAKSFGFAAASTAAIVYSICSLLVVLFPRGMSAVISYVLHLDLTAMARPISWGSYCIGVVSLSAASGIIIALVAWFYNRFRGDSPVHPRTRENSQSC